MCASFSEAEFSVFGGGGRGAKEVADTFCADCSSINKLIDRRSVWSRTRGWGRRGGGSNLLPSLTVWRLWGCWGWTTRRLSATTGCVQIWWYCGLRVKMLLSLPTRMTGQLVWCLIDLIVWPETLIDHQVIPFITPDLARFNKFVGSYSLSSSRIIHRILNREKKLLVRDFYLELSDNNVPWPRT